MTIYNPDTNKPMRHFAQDEITKERYIVIALQNDTDPNTCSVINMDALDGNLRAELQAAVFSEEFQRVPEIWSLLDRKFFLDYPNDTMLKVLKALHQIKVVDQERVIVELPNDETMNAKQVVEAINKYRNSKEGGSARFNPSTSSATATPVAPVAPAVEDAKLTEMDGRISKIEDKLNSISDSFAELISVMKMQATSKTEGE
jgi:hypothetical protein